MSRLREQLSPDLSRIFTTGNATGPFTHALLSQPVIIMFPQHPQQVSGFSVPGGNGNI
jgi:hypothetical protein